MSQHYKNTLWLQGFKNASKPLDMFEYQLFFLDANKGTFCFLHFCIELVCLRVQSLQDCLLFESTYTEAQ